MAMYKPHKEDFFTLLDYLRFLPEDTSNVTLWALRLYTVRTLIQNRTLYSQNGLAIPETVISLNHFSDLQNYLRILRTHSSQFKYLFQGELGEVDSFRWEVNLSKWDHILRFWNRIDTYAEDLNTLEQYGSDIFQFALNELISHSNFDVTSSVSATLIAQFLSTDSPHKIYDPACGVGNQLIACGRKSRQQGIIQPDLFGQDISPILLEFASLHCLLLGFTRFQLALGDTLQKPGFAKHGTLEKFPLVVIDPPFGKTESREQWNLSRDHFSQFWLEGLQRNLEWAFVQHGFASLEPQGQLAVLMNAGTLTRGSDELKLRKHLIEQDWLEAVIAIPQGTWFDNSKLQGYVIILTRKKRPELQHCVTMIDLSKVPINQKDKSDVSFYEQSLQAYRNLTEIPGQVQFVYRNTIASSYYNLQPAHYLKVIEESQPINIETMRKKVLIFKEETDRAGREFDEAISALQILQN